MRSIPLPTLQHSHSPPRPRAHPHTAPLVGYRVALAGVRSAEFHSAVSRSCTPQGVRRHGDLGNSDALRSFATLPTASRRYSRVKLCATSESRTLRLSGQCPDAPILAHAFL